MALEFGVFDHVDRNDLPLAQFYEDRLKLIEAYDRAGIYGYHCAEHHSTPLGMAPSPSVFLSAIGQRTTRLRFGTFVYALPVQLIAYHTAVALGTDVDQPRNLAKSVTVE